MPFVWLTPAFLGGILLASAWRGHWGVWLVILLLPIAAQIALVRLPWNWTAFLTRRHPAMKFPPLLLIAALGAGGLRYILAQPGDSSANLIWHNDRDRVRLTAVVTAPPDRREKVTLLYLQAETIAPADNVEAAQAVRGRLVVMLPRGAEWQYGDRLMLIGVPITPMQNEDFSYRDYLAHRGIYTSITYPYVQLLERQAGRKPLFWLYRLRDRAAGVIARLYPVPEAPLLTGILLGDDSGLPEAVEAAFRSSGTSHIIAISGFNMAVLAGLFSTLFGRLLRRNWATLGAIGTLALYTLLVGANPAVVRALIMSSLALVAVQIGRPAGGLNSLLLAAEAMCLGNPGLLWDISFQLSCAATLGLILYAGPLQGAATRLLERKLAPERAQKIAGPLGEFVLFTLAAQATTLPIIAFHFQRLSLGTFLANPLILPPQPLVMVLGGLSVIGGLIWLPLGQVLSWAAWPFLAYSVRIAEIFGGQPGSELILDPIHPLLLALYYALLLGLTFARGWLVKVKERIQPVAVIVVVGALALFAWRAALAGADGRLHLYLFNTDGQTALLVRGPEGLTLLVGGAASEKALSDALARRLPPGVRWLDGWLYPGPDTSLGALEGLFKHYSPRAVYRCATMPNSATAEELESSLRDVPNERVYAGQTLRMGEVVTEIVASAEGCDLLLRYGNFQALLHGSGLRLPGGEVLEAAEGHWLHLTTDGQRLWIEEGR
ncbi:MAG: ComEC/Rec2 family competence protein [Anaerolineaceae bacterium]|nr:ComEC/Rec2 family competence protein [Anaerolineaceae bacterium]